MSTRAISNPTSWRSMPRNVWIVTITSFLTDVSSEMIFNLLPLFLNNVLGVKTNLIGVIEGVAETTASLLKIVSGWLSDKLGQRKSLTVIGYGLSTAAKPFLYVVGSWWGVLAVRFSDRVGKGIRTAPRDALIADSIDEHRRGSGEGHRVRRGGVRLGRHDHLVARAVSQGETDQVHTRGAGGDGHRVGSARPGGKGALEVLRAGAMHENRPVEDLHDRPLLLVADDRPTKRQGRQVTAHPGHLQVPWRGWIRAPLPLIAGPQSEHRAVRDLAHLLIANACGDGPFAHVRTIRVNRTGAAGRAEHDAILCGILLRADRGPQPANRTSEQP